MSKLLQLFLISRIKLRSAREFATAGVVKGRHSDYEDKTTWVLQELQKCSAVSYRNVAGMDKDVARMSKVES